MRARDRVLVGERVVDLREAAEIHRQVRADMQRNVRPGMRMVDICEYVYCTGVVFRFLSIVSVGFMSFFNFS